MSLYLGENCISAGGSSAFRNTNIGEIIQSTIPLTDAGLHLLDGSVISGNGAYSAFVTHIAGLVSGHSELFTTEANWQTSNDNYGACDKFVYDSVNNTVRLPKRVTDHGVLIKSYSAGTDWYRIYSDGWCEQGSHLTSTAGDTTIIVDLLKSYIDINYYINLTSNSPTTTFNGAQPNWVSSRTTSTFSAHLDAYPPNGAGDWQASGYIDISDIQQIPVYEYIVLANSVKTPIEVDIDEVMTDLNGKVDIADLAECSVIVETYRNGASWYRVWSDGWCEQGGHIEESGINVVNVSFLKAYTSIPTLLTSVNSTSRTSFLDNGIDVFNLTTTGFTKQYTVNVGTGWAWQACGYIS